MPRGLGRGRKVADDAVQTEHHRHPGDSGNPDLVEREVQYFRPRRPQCPDPQPSPAIVEEYRRHLPLEPAQRPFLPDSVLALYPPDRLTVGPVTRRKRRERSPLRDGIADPPLHPQH